MNVVITGAGRGIGLGFVKRYLALGANVCACYRSDKSQLEQISDRGLKIVQWNVTEDKAPTFLAASNFPETIDVLINNAGIYGPNKAAGQSLENVSPQSMLDVFDVNCVGPLRVVQLLRDRLIAAKGKIANISSKMGSTEDNTSGGCYAYRASKSALIIISKSMAIDLAPYDVRVVTLHPGWVRTDMTSNNGLIDIKESVSGMSKVIDNIDHYCPGSFVKYNGQVIPY